MPGLYTDISVDRTWSDPYLSQASVTPGNKSSLLRLTPFVMAVAPASSGQQAAVLQTKIVLTPIYAAIMEAWKGPSMKSLDVPIFSSGQLGALSQDLPQHAPQYPLRDMVAFGLAQAGYAYLWREEWLSRLKRGRPRRS